jgi:hypothetical protein
MFKAMRAMSIAALAAAGLSFSVTHWAFPPVGYEGMLWLAGLALWVGIFCIVGTIAFGCIIFTKRRGVNVAWPLACCATAGVLMFFTVHKL